MKWLLWSIHLGVIRESEKVISKYIIQTFTSSKADLIALVRRNLNASYKTVFNCITKLIEKSILAFDDVLDDGFSINLLKYNSGWMKVLKTKCKYYAKYTIDKMLNKYSEVFKNNSETERLKDLSPKRNANFKFYFECEAINTKTKEDDYIELVKINNASEYNLVMEKVKFAEITLTKKLVMHLVRAIANIKEWFLKERITQLIVNKYRAIQIHKSRENIKSLPAYAAAVVRSVVNEYKIFKTNIVLNNVRNYEVGEYFMEYVGVGTDPWVKLPINEADKMKSFLF